MRIFIGDAANRLTRPTVTYTKHRLSTQHRTDRGGAIILPGRTIGTGSGGGSWFNCHKGGFNHSLVGWWLYSHLVTKLPIQPRRSHHTLSIARTLLGLLCALHENWPEVVVIFSIFCSFAIRIPWGVLKLIICQGARIMWLSYICEANYSKQA